MIMNTSNTLIANCHFDKSSYLYLHQNEVCVPDTLRELIVCCNPHTSLEVGCGLCGFSSYLTGQGIRTTTICSIDKLNMLATLFDISFDTSYFHCLCEEEHERYVSELYRLLKHQGVHLLWALDSTPSNLKLTSEYIAKTFGQKFHLVGSEYSKKKNKASHWYWLIRR
ncbi:hypothetical protein FACS1894174_01040 [Bacteroidia bacterium]|nr:hypothetical protein FACS1894174_01040 [Bacteroidia bacterium]